MDVIDKFVYRVIPIDKAASIDVGDIVPIPTEREVFDGNQRKIETENYFEEIRKNSFPQMPSRKAALFVLPYDNSFVESWVELHNPHNDFDYFLCTLQVSGSLFWCDEDKFTQAGIFPALRHQLAIDYWRKASESYELFEIAEGLFIGTAIIKSIDIQHHSSSSLD